MPKLAKTLFLGLKILVSPVRFLVVPLQRDAKSHKTLKFNEFQGFLFPRKTQKTTLLGRVDI